MVDESNNKFLENLYQESSWNLYKTLEKIARDELIKFYEEEEKIKFPIDIREIIKKNKIDIAEMDLNLDTGFRMDKVNGYLRCLNSSTASNDSLKWRIYIEYSDSEFVKRYVLTHEFSHYLLKRYSSEAVELTEEKCIDPMFPKKKEELVTDILSAYFLLPPNTLLETMVGYRNEMKKNNQYPIDSVTFLHKIGNRAQISTYHTILCYQYVRYYFCALYEQRIREMESAEQEEKKSALEWLKEYGDFFK